MWRALAVAVLTLLSVGAAAQTTSLAPSKALGCLTLAEGERSKPEYPPELLQSKQGGIVSVELDFDAPDQPPKMKLQGKQVPRPFADSVEAFVKRLRVPCMGPEDGQVKLTQQYEFSPLDGGKVLAGRSTDPDAARRAAQLVCLHQEPPRLGYPIDAARNNQGGGVLIRLRFTRPDAPPEVKVLAAPAGGGFDALVVDYVSGDRLPCLTEGPVETMQLYKFHMDGQPQAHLSDMSLLDFLRSAADVPTGAHFDLDAMHCPFDLRLTYYQPYEKNWIEQLDSMDPGRELLIEWLEKIALKVPENLKTDVLGEKAIMHVPCGKIDL